MVSKGEQTRQVILDHATREAARLGLEGLTIGNLAKELGMSKSGLFAHFDSKDALQVAVIEAGSEQFTEAVLRPAMRAPRGEPRLRALFDRWLGWSTRDRAEVGCLFVAAAAELDDRPCPARDRLVAQQRDWLDFIASVTRVTVSEGQFRSDLDPAQFAFELYGIVLSYHQQSRLLRDPEAETRARRAFERLITDARKR